MHIKITLLWQYISPVGELLNVNVLMDIKTVISNGIYNFHTEEGVVLSSVKVRYQLASFITIQSCKQTF